MQNYNKLLKPTIFFAEKKLKCCLLSIAVYDFSALFFTLIFLLIKRNNLLIALLKKRAK